MLSFLKKIYHPPGTPPGTLVRHAHEKPVPLNISLLDYDDANFEEKWEISVEDCDPYLSRPTTTWIHVHGHIEPEALRRLAEMFTLHPLAIEDVLNIGQRPKAETYDDQLFIIMSLLLVNAEGMRANQVSLFMGKDYVISFYAGRHDPFEPVRERLRQHVGRLRSRPADFLLYALLDIIIDQGFPVLEKLGEDIEELETALLTSPDTGTLNRLHHLKREMLLLRRTLWPHREILDRMMRDENVLVGDDTRLFLRDCYDHTIQIMDFMEIYRDMTAGMLDIYLSSVSNRLNETMRVLTIIATLFIPPTFIVGLYGMNFDRAASGWNMPELGWQYGYPFAWLAIMACAAGMLFYFRRKKWL